MSSWAKNALCLALPAAMIAAVGHAGALPGAAEALQLQTIADIPLGGNPTRLDYASLDAGRHLLFIAHLGDSEVIVVSGGRVSKTGESFLAPDAHVVAIQPLSHEIYFPLEDVGGKPVLRIMRNVEE